MRKTSNTQNLAIDFTDRTQLTERTTMTFTQLTHQIAENHNLTQAQAKAIAKDVFATITQCLARGESIRVTDFGTFTLAQVNERNLSPAMGGGVLPAHNRAKFKPAKALKEAVN